MRDYNGRQGMTIKILKVLIALAGIFFVAMGLTWIFAPTTLAPLFAIVPEGIKGMNTLRADLGSFFLCIGIFSIVAARINTHSVTLLACVALVMAVAAFGRLVGFILDGFIIDTFAPFFVEIIFVILYMTLAVLVKKQNESIVTETSETEV